MISDSTIAAVATGCGEAGINVVRISGTNSLAIGDAVFRCAHGNLKDAPDRCVKYGHVQENGRDLDEAMAIVMRGPRSYTREDVVEIQCHGGRLAARRTLTAVLNAGAMSAEPGEFTKRAFLNGRIDLVQAEGVLDLIRAQSDRAANAAVEQIEGSITNALTSSYNNLIGALSVVEATLDFVEDELPDRVFGDARKNMTEAMKEIEGLLATWHEGHLLREGIIVVISGRPNAGKSTLLNRLLGRDRAIVSDQPGTTRDSIEESMVLEGVPVRLIDTAGLRQTDCAVEKEGVSRTLNHMKRADLHIYVVDASIPEHAEDRQNIARLPTGKAIIVRNKNDLVSASQQVPPEKDAHIVHTSLLTGDGLERIKELLVEKCGLCEQGESHAAISERHRRLLLDSATEVKKAEQLMEESMEENLVLVATHLRSALDSMGRITGRVYHEELLDTIFSRFCIGK